MSMHIEYFEITQHADVSTSKGRATHWYDAASLLLWLVGHFLVELGSHVDLFDYHTRERR